MAYTPTHEIPAGGLPAWQQPDGSQPPVTTLAGGLDVQLVEMRGQWANILCSNGWQGWIDGARLMARAAPVSTAVPTAAPAPTPAPAAPTPQTAIAPAESMTTADPGQVPRATAEASTPLIPESPIASPIIPDTPSFREEAHLDPAVGREGAVVSQEADADIEPAPAASEAGGASFKATHTIPRTGLPMWAEPDPSQPALATLAAGTEARATEERGQWVKIELANGWEGWVDARLLVKPEPAPAPVAAPAPAAPVVATAPVPAPAPTPAAPAFIATHVAPAGGLQAWSSPDPSQPATTTLGAGTQLRIVEQRGQWARVEASNGWWGWVDGARLAPRA